MVAIKQIIRYLYVPFMLFGVNGAALYIVAFDHSYLWLGVLALVAVGLSFLAEHILPYEEDWNQGKGDFVKDTLHALVYEVSSFNAVVIGLPLVTALVPWSGIWPTQWPFVVQVLMAVVAADIGVTLIHYISHKVDWLWRLHAVHHGVVRLYGFNGLVRHPLHHILDLSFGTLPLILAGMPFEVAVVLAFTSSVQLLVQHSNADYELGPFKYVLAIGPVHRLHHVNWDGEGDVNFGLYFTFWDMMLGTFRLNVPQVPVAGDIGIQDMPNYPQTYFKQLIQPFVQEQTEVNDRPQKADSQDRRTKIFPAE